MKVSVRTKDIIKAIEKRTAKLKTEYERNIAVYERKMVAHRKTILRILRAAYRRFERGKMPIDRFGNVRISFPDPPEKPSKPSLCALETRVKLLKLCNQETLMLDERRYSQYFQECCS